MNRNTTTPEYGNLVSDYTIRPISFLHVQLEDGFWRPRLETNRLVTIPAVLAKCDYTGRVDNFRRAAGRRGGSFEGAMPFDDTDVYKAIEGASYALLDRSDPQLEIRLEGLVEIVAAAQEPDGYLYTNRTIDPSHVHPFAGPVRWSNLAMSHELYNCGHLYEAACAHYLATGRRTLLDVALRSAGLIEEVFGADGRRDIPGHPIVEMALARLYRVTGDRRHLEAARRFLEDRGRHETRKPYSYADDPGYCQDHLPVRSQTEAVGHAVRATYMYCGMADVAALWPDNDYAEAITTIWDDVAESKIYLTGAIGARHSGESFGERYELPNKTGYGETCASIGSVMWNHRLFLLTGESRYIDVLEQTLYNGLLAGVSLRGDEFFYTNPLESDGEFAFNHGSNSRQPWFDVSCCPTNLCRFFPSLPGYVYAASGEGIYTNLFVSGRAWIPVNGDEVEITQETDYPWDGRIRITITLPEGWTALGLPMRIRIPGWATGRILGGSLYRFATPSDRRVEVTVNGAPWSAVTERGYAIVDREWRNGDAVEVRFPMMPRKVVCDPRVTENRGLTAIQRGPIVYCVEQRDAEVPLDSLSVGEESLLESRFDDELLDGVVTVRGPGFVAVPYYAWGNRGPGPMRVWLKDADAERR